MCYEVCDIRSIRELSGRTTGRFGCIVPVRQHHRRDCAAGTTRLYHLRTYRGTMPIQLMIMGQLEHLGVFRSCALDASDLAEIDLLTSPADP